MYSGSEAGSYLRPIDSCITQLNAQGPSRTCNESKEEDEGEDEDGKLKRVEEEALALLQSGTLLLLLLYSRYRS